MAQSGSLLERLANGGSLVVAEGYIFEFERRGYLQAGAFVPEVVIERPDLVKIMHEEFVHAGSEVVLAFTYYGHREKLRLVGREDELETMNRRALSIAREVARSTGTLFAGNICNSTIYKRDDDSSKKATEAMFKEQIEWAVEEGVDYIVGETFGELGEAMLALESIKKYGKGVPAVITLASAGHDYTFDDVLFEDACRQLEEAGAAVVGLNCGRGPGSILGLMKKIRAACKGPIACLPVPYRTSEKFPTMQSLQDPDTGKQSFPYDLPGHTCTRSEIENFAKSCKELGVNYVGLCCGNCSHYTRIVAEVYGRKPPASRFSPDMSKHFMYGDKSKFDQYHTEEMVKFTKADN
ncbi:betaine--homocysteine S-methyltransferase 1-like [Physella acuta]|uniref:betaine--homocysteine S-methyltransferase 1-like n=1 Tax=Physella acuta TaxID=109671 RepID=UPI0027DD35A1|nr:betaine--homocysteine S-methyltransferase 1-like [Physella acuta]